MGRRVHARFTPAQARDLAEATKLLLDLEDPGDLRFLADTRQYQVVERALNQLNTAIEKAAKGDDHAGTGPDHGADRGADAG